MVTTWSIGRGRGLREPPVPGSWTPVARVPSLDGVLGRAPRLSAGTVAVRSHEGGGYQSAISSVKRGTGLCGPVPVGQPWSSSPALAAASAATARDGWNSLSSLHGPGPPASTRSLPDLP